MNNMDILLIIPPFHRRNGSGKIFPMGTGYLVSAIKNAGFSWRIYNCTEIIDSCYEEDLKLLYAKLTDELGEISPRVIGIGPCVTSHLKALKLIAEACRTVLPNTPLFAGGPFTSISGQETVFYKILGIKWLIKGDGEEAIVDAIRMAKSGKKLSDSRYVSYEGHEVVNAIENLDDIAFPYRPESDDQFSLRRKSAASEAGRIMPMIASRGCLYKCSYCVSGNMKENAIPYRWRSYSNIIEEMLELKRNYGVNNVVFYDDCFFARANTINKDVEAFCNELFVNNVEMLWQIELRPDAFAKLTNSSIKLLKKFGCSQINIGIEKFTKQGLDFLGKGAQWQGLNEQVSSVINAGIKVSATFIIGGGTETEEDVKALVRDAKQLNLSFAQFNPLFVYPGTPIYSRQFKTDLEWVDVVLNDDLPWGEILYENGIISKERVLELVDYAYEEYYKGTKYEQENMVEDRFNIKRKRSITSDEKDI